MAFVKANLQKTTDTNDGEPVEVITVKLQYEVFPGETMEEVRQRHQQRVDRLFAEMFHAELKAMPGRVAEGQKWVQQGLFDGVQG